MKRVIVVLAVFAVVAVIVGREVTTGQPQRPDIEGVPVDELAVDLSLPAQAQDAIPEDEAIRIAEAQAGGRMKAKQAVLAQMDAADFGPAAGAVGQFKGAVWAVSLDTAGVRGNAAGKPAAIDYKVIFLDARTGEFLYAQSSNTPIVDEWSDN